MSCFCLILKVMEKKNLTAVDLCRQLHQVV